MNVVFPAIIAQWNPRITREPTTPGTVEWFLTMDFPHFDRPGERFTESLALPEWHSDEEFASLIVAAVAWHISHEVSEQLVVNGEIPLHPHERPRAFSEAAMRASYMIR